jgi:predicted transposase/invertase (TIGR01784 family)
MKYLPTNNLLFSKCFSSPQSTEILSGFINDVLGIKVNDIHIENPYDVAWIKERLSYTTVDVLARLPDRRLVTIEMQCLPQKSFDLRAAHYLSSRYVASYGDERLIPKDYQGQGQDAKYASLHPVCGINVCNFALFKKNDDPLRIFKLYDTTYNEEYAGGLLTIVFLQLVKKPLTGQEKLRPWFEFFKGLPLSGDVPDYIIRAQEMTKYANLSKEERKMIDDAERSREDMKGQLCYAREEGEKRGEQRGIALGEKRGIALGEQRIIQQMSANGFDIPSIAKATGYGERQVAAMLGKG